MNLEFIKPQNLGPLLMKSSQSNFNLRSPGAYLVRSCLITTVQLHKTFHSLFLRFETNYEVEFVAKLPISTISLKDRSLKIDLPTWLSNYGKLLF